MSNMSEEDIVSTEPEAPKKSGAGIAWLAMLLAVMAFVLVGYQQWQNWRTASSDSNSSAELDSSLARLETKIQTSAEALAALQSEVETLRSADGSNANDIEQLRRSIAEQVRQLEALPSRIGGIEASLTTLQGISVGARDRWLLGEAEYYLQLANAQLQLANNPSVAAAALEMADGRIAQLGNPALTGVRAAISDELAAIDAMDKPDIEGMTLSLASLAGVVDALPLRDVVAEMAAAEEVEIEVEAEEESGVDRAWSSVKGAMSGLIQHREVAENSIPLIAPEAEYFLRTNLALQLETARLALLRNEQTIYEQSLTDASSWLSTYFDGSSEQVQTAQQSIRELQQRDFIVAPPDISGSLRALRQFNALAEAAE
ncbi:MAG: uroporphyrinogen-III C-methyltransferase [Pseudomonadota bacterium]